MISRFKKLFCIILSVVCVGTASVPAYATNNLTNNTLNYSHEVAIPTTARSATILSEAGILENTTKAFTFTVPSSTTYTFTMSVRNIIGTSGIWAFLQGQNGEIKIDKIVSSSYQKRMSLTSGTWYLRLTSSPNTCSYSVTIHETF